MGGDGDIRDQFFIAHALDMRRICFGVTFFIFVAVQLCSGDFLVVLRRRSIDPHRSWIDCWPRWRQQTDRTTRATREKQNREPIPGQPVIRDRAMIDAKGGAVYQC